MSLTQPPTKQACKVRIVLHLKYLNLVISQVDVGLNHQTTTFKVALQATPKEVATKAG